MARMRDQTNLVRRSGVYLFRIAVPVGLRGHFNGTREIRKSLRTRDKAEAIKLVAAERVRVLAEFERLRKALNPERRDQLSDAEVAHLIAAWTAEQLARDERSRALGQIDLDAVEESLSEGEFLLTSALPSGNIKASGLAPEVARVLREHGLSLPVDSVSWRLLAFELLKAAARLNHALKARQTGEVVETPGPPGPLRVGGDSLLAFVGYWKTQGERRPKTVKAVEAAAKAFGALHPQLSSARQIERKHVIAFRDRLLEQGKSPKTIAKLVALLSAVLQCAADGDRLPSNPAERIKVPPPKIAAKSRLPFTFEQLKTLIGALPDDDPDMRWIVLVGMVTGARLAEIVQLRVADVREQDGIKYIQITHEAGGLKNIGSERRVPLHAQLLGIGFMAFVQGREKAGQARLFDVGADAASKRFGRWLTKIGINDSRLVYHSLRHGFITVCREAEVHESVAAALVGHAVKNIHGTYGEMPLKTLADAVASLTFPLPGSIN